MTRANLEELGLSKKQIDSIMAINGSDIENAKAAGKKEVEGLNEQIKERDKQLEELKKNAGDNEALTQKIAELQTENKTAAEKYAAEMNKLKLDHAVERELTKARAKNLTAVRALLDLDDVKFDGDGNVKGLAEQVEKMKTAEDSKFLFAESMDETIKSRPTRACEPE